MSGNVLYTPTLSVINTTAQRIKTHMAKERNERVIVSEGAFKRVWVTSYIQVLTCIN